MRINEVIKTKRKVLGLTQEYVAEYIGVSIPAVSKWEKGTSYPDITLSPILARLLKVDLNTLLSFNECLTECEINHFITSLNSKMEEEGDFDEIFQMATSKIHEYPSCDVLAWEVAVLLNRMLTLNSIENKEAYEDRVLNMLKKLIDSHDDKIRNQAISFLCATYMFSEEYEKAEQMVNQLPDSTIDKREQQAYLYIQQKRLSEAETILEEKLFTELNELQQNLLMMVNISLQENRFEDAEYYADLSEKTVEIYSHMEFTAYIPYLEIAIAKQDADRGIKLLKLLLNSTENNTMTTTKFHQIIDKFSKVPISTLVNPLIINLEEKLKNDPSFEFLHQHPDFDDLIKKLENMNSAR